MRLKVFAILALFTALLLSACGGDSVNEETSSKETEPVNIKELVQEYSTGSFVNEKASITGTELIVTGESGKESVYELPEDEFFVSVAPYIHQTHP